MCRRKVCLGFATKRKACLFRLDVEGSCKHGLTIFCVKMYAQIKEFFIFSFTQNKTDKEKEEKYSPKNCKLRRLSKPPFHTSTSPETGSKLDSAEAKNTDQAPVKSVEITSIINGLQGIVYKLFQTL